MSSSLFQIVSENVRIHRARLRLTQEQLAKKAGIAKSYVGKIERAAGSISLDTLDDLAKALEMKPHELLIPYSDARKSAA